MAFIIDGCEWKFRTTRERQFVKIEGQLVEYVALIQRDSSLVTITEVAGPEIQLEAAAHAALQIAGIPNAGEIPTTLSFSIVGSVVYTVHIKAEPFTGPDGKNAWGLCDPEHLEIWLSHEIPPERRRKILIHELVHAWECHAPIPRTSEERAEWAGTIFDSMDTQLSRQGGAQMLMRMRPEASKPRRRKGGRAA